MGRIYKSTATGLKYGVEFLQNRIPIVFLDHYHRKDNGLYPNANEATYAFKDGNLTAVSELIPPVIEATLSNFATMRGLTHVAPMLGHSNLKANPNSATYRLAEAVASKMHLEFDGDTLRQTTTREGLHLDGRVRQRAEREGLIESVIAVDGDLTDRHYLLVDDIFTTGATMSVCTSRITEAGGLVRGGVVLMRYLNEGALLNPKIYDDLVRKLA